MSAKYLIALLLSLLQAPLDAPLPEFNALWQATRAYLLGQYDETELLKGYTYRVNSVAEDLDSKSSVKKTNTVEAEVYFFNNGPFRKVISVNGVPLSPSAIKKQDEEFEKFKKRKPGSGGGPPWRGRRQRSPKEQAELIDDLYQAFDFTVVRREMRDGRPTIVVDFKPRKNPKLNTKVASLFLTKVEGTAWVDETDHRLAKVEVHFLEDAKLALGLLARVGKETEYIREWTKVNDELWLPRLTEVRFKGRIFLAKGFNQRTVQKFSDYKKFLVETKIQVGDEVP